jgi:hypothetical protein
LVCFSLVSSSTASCLSVGDRKISRAETFMLSFLRKLFRR